MKLNTPINYDKYSQMFFDSDNRHIADMRGYGWVKDEVKQDELEMNIVKIINSHDRLVERLYQQNIDLKILLTNVIDANKTKHRLDGMPDLIQRWIDKNQELIES